MGMNMLLPYSYRVTSARNNERGENALAAETQERTTVGGESEESSAPRFLS